MDSNFNRRRFLSGTAALAGSPLVLPGSARAATSLNFHAWSAAVDQVKSHISAFEARSGIKVGYSNSPWAQYREGMITKLVAKAPIDGRRRIWRERQRRGRYEQRHEDEPENGNQKHRAIPRS